MANTLKQQGEHIKTHGEHIKTHMANTLRQQGEHIKTTWRTQRQHGGQQHIKTRGTH